MQLPLRTSRRFNLNDSAQRIEGSFWLRNDGAGGPSAAAENELLALPAATLTSSRASASATPAIAPAPAALPPAGSVDDLLHHMRGPFTDTFGVEQWQLC